MPAYFVFGLRIFSEIELPELLVTEAPEGIDVTIRIGAVPGVDADAPHMGPVAAVGNDGLVLDIEGTARFYVRAGVEIVVEPAPESSSRDIRTYLLGSVLGGMLCHQRGLLPLHANTIRMGDRAIAFAGQSGAGKSTLAAHFQSKGYDVLGDDVCVVSFNESGSPVVYPGILRLKLWNDAIEALGRNREGLQIISEGTEKYQYSIAPPTRLLPLPLERMYILDEKDTAPGSISRLTGSGAMDAVIGQVYRSHIPGLIGAMPRHMGLNVRLAKTLSIFRATRRRGFDIFGDEAGKLEQHVLTGQF